MTDTDLLNEIAEALESRGFVHCTNGDAVGQILDNAALLHKTLTEISAHLYSQQDLARCRDMAAEALKKSLFL